MIAATQYTSKLTGRSGSAAMDYSQVCCSEEADSRVAIHTPRLREAAGNSRRALTHRRRNITCHEGDIRLERGW